MLVLLWLKMLLGLKTLLGSKFCCGSKCCWATHSTGIIYICYKSYGNFGRKQVICPCLYIILCSSLIYIVTLRTYIQLSLNGHERVGSLHGWIIRIKNYHSMIIHRLVNIYSLVGSGPTPSAGRLNYSLNTNTRLRRSGLRMVAPGRAEGAPGISSASGPYTAVT